MRGHGSSSKPSGGYGTADFASDIIDVMDRLAIKSAALVGHSMGSLVAQRIAAEHPDRVSSLMLIGAFATSTWPACTIPSIQRSRGLSSKAR